MDQRIDNNLSKYDLSKLTEAEQNMLEAFSLFSYLPLAAETCNEWMLADAGASEDDDILIGLYQKGGHCGLAEACQKHLEIPEF